VVGAFVKTALSESVDSAADRPAPPLRVAAGEGSEFVLDAADRLGAPLDVAALAASGS
jgi:hypothetical protein